MVRHRNHIRSNPRIHTQAIPEDNNIVPTEARQMKARYLIYFILLGFPLGMLLGGLLH
jgi:hypothetical protein